MNKTVILLSFTLISNLIACDVLAQAERAGQADSEDRDPPIRIFTEDRLQQISHWGHDIKQLGKALTMTPEAAQEIFAEGRYNVLRIPFYANAHHPDGSLKENYHVSMVAKGFDDDALRWELVPAEDGWFHLRNVFHDKFIRALPPGRGPWEQPNTLEIDSKIYTGTWTQWRPVDAGNGWYHLESRGHNRFLRATAGGNLALMDKENRGPLTQWRMQDAGDETFRLTRNGLDKYLHGGGSEYDLVMDAVHNAVNNGNPELFVSHKIYDAGDHRTPHNVNFGPFYTANGIDAVGFAAALDAFVEFLEEETGQPVAYLAPRCELGNHWTPEVFVEIVNNLRNRRKIVSPEAAWAVNSERFWTPEVAEVTDIRATHNKMNSPPWPENARYDWDSETIGGTRDRFSNLFFKLHEAFYKGGVTGIVFWGDVHLTSTPDDGNNGPFRRELVEASRFPLIRADIASDRNRSVIAFATENPDSVHVFYCATEPIRLEFDRPLNPDGIPQEASGITTNGFDMPRTGNTDFGSFILSFSD